MKMSTRPTVAHWREPELPSINFVVTSPFWKEGLVKVVKKPLQHYHVNSIQSLQLPGKLLHPGPVELCLKTGKMRKIPRNAPETGQLEGIPGQDGPGKG